MRMAGVPTPRKIVIVLTVAGPLQVQAIVTTVVRVRLRATRRTVMCRRWKGTIEVGGHLGTRQDAMEDLSRSTCHRETRPS